MQHFGLVSCMLLKKGIQLSKEAVILTCHKYKGNIKSFEHIVKSLVSVNPGASYTKGGYRYPLDSDSFNCHRKA